MPRGHGPRLKSRKDTTDYENRLRTITRMAIRKITEGEIAMTLGIDQATVSRDLEVIRRQNLKDIQEKYPQNEQKELLAEMEMHFKEVERELWAEANHGNAPSSRIAALRAIREIWSDRVDLLLRLGLIAMKSQGAEPAHYDEFLAQIEARRKARGQEVSTNST